MGAAAAMGPLLGGTAEAAEAAEAATPTAQSEIKHVIFLMMENRSFDHLLGSLSGVRGFDDTSIKRPDGGNIFAQYDSVGSTKDLPNYRLPFNLTNAMDAQGDADLSHNWGPQHISLNGGRNDNWVGAHRAADGDTDGIFTMAYLTRTEVPYHYAMADAFTICDNYFCSVLGPTYPNRFMWEMGTLDADHVGGGPLLTTDASIFSGNNRQGVFNFKTYPEKLTNAGITWRAYTDPATNDLLNMFGAFTQYNVPAIAAAGTNPTAVANATTNVDSGTYNTAVGGFLADLDSGQLPQVTWIFPTAQSTEHPGDGPINAGPQFYEPIITALQNSPIYGSTVLFITYDENDGYFDHVPPPQAPAGTDGEFLLGPAYGSTSVTDPTTGKTTLQKDPSMGIHGPVGLGFRVPCYVISPWSTGGRYNSELFDHTSGLKLVETVFSPLAKAGTDISPKPIVSDWRYNLVGDLTSTMDFANPKTLTTAQTTTLAQAFALSQTLLAPMGTEKAPAAVRTYKASDFPAQESSTAHPRTRIGPDQSAKSSGGVYDGVDLKPAAGTDPGATAATPALPEVGQPALMLGAGMAAALSAVAYKRIRSGGKSDATHAGGHLPRYEAPGEAMALEGEPSA